MFKQATPEHVDKLLNTVSEYKKDRAVTDEELSVRDTVCLTGVSLFALWLLGLAAEWL